ncbi:MAG: hypothetical protein LBI63_05800 [Candidatus Ancillula sp.]|jgi:hypothetical protein|nr:hypothetical protein [Candidatus Ancillula sp.]
MKKLVNIFVVVLMLVSSFCNIKLAQAAVVAENECKSGGSPYIICTAQELDELPRHDLSGSFILGADIDLKPYLTPGGTGFSKYQLEKWLPIGSIDNPFTGTFDGRGHIISGLEINRLSSDDIGLFGNTIDAHISNLVVKIGASGVLGGKNVGAIIGNQVIDNGSRDLINNVHAYGYIAGSENIGGLFGQITVQGGAVASSDSSHFDGEIHSTSGFVGGLFGKVNILNGGNIILKTSFSIGEILISSANSQGVAGLIGGIVANGGAEAEVQASYSTMNISSPGSSVAGLIGGFLGSDGAILTVDQSYVSGQINGVSSVGSIFGSIYAARGANAYIVDTYSKADVFGEDNCGGIIGSVEVSSGGHFRVFDIYNIGSLVRVNRSSGGNFGQFIGSAQTDNSNLTIDFSHSYFNPTNMVANTLIGYTHGSVTFDDADARTNEQLLEKATYIGWDFDKTWGMFTKEGASTKGESYGHPYLKVMKNEMLITPIHTWKESDNTPAPYPIPWCAAGGGDPYDDFSVYDNDDTTCAQFRDSKYKKDEFSLTGQLEYSALDPTNPGVYHILAGTLDLQNPYYQEFFKGGDANRPDYRIVKFYTNRATVPVGQKIELHGEGFQPRETVNLFSNTTTFPLSEAATVDENGSFMKVLEVPSDATLGEVTLQSVDSQSVIRTTSFEILEKTKDPEIATSSAKLAAGDVMHISGTGFTPNSAVKVLAPNIQIPDVASSSSGEVSVDLTIPLNTPQGNFSLMLYDEVSGIYSNQAVTFIDVFRFQVSDIVLHPGANFNAAVGNGVNNGEVHISSTAHDWGNFPLNNSGRLLQTQLQLPLSEKSTIESIQAEDLTTGISRTSSISVSVPKIEQILPQNPVAGGNLQLFGSGFLPNSTVTAYIDGVQVGKFKTDQSGYTNINAPVIRIPSSAVDSVVVKLADLGGGVNYAQRRVYLRTSSGTSDAGGGGTNPSGGGGTSGGGTIIDDDRDPNADLPSTPISDVPANRIPDTGSDDISALIDPSDGFTLSNSTAPKGGEISVKGGNLTPSTSYTFTSPVTETASFITDNSGVLQYGAYLKVLSNADSGDWELAITSNETGETINLPFSITTPTFKFDADCVHPGRAYYVSAIGEGLQPNALFDLYQGGAKLTSGVTSTIGRIVLQTTVIPYAQEAGSELSYKIVDRYTGAETGTVKLKIANPTISADENTVSLGDDFVFAGSGFVPNRPITAKIVTNNGATLVSGEFKADASGTVNSTLTIPATAPKGEYMLVVNDDRPGKSRAYLKIRVV